MKAIPMSKWGRDHLSTLAYVETVVVDHKGVPNLDKMRVNQKRHPGLLGPHQSRFLSGNDTAGYRYPTMLKDGKLVKGHDDHDCVDDFVAAGLVELKGTGKNPVYSLTEAGFTLTARLRKHLATEDTIKTFKP